MIAVMDLIPVLEDARVRHGTTPVAWIVSVRFWGSRNVLSFRIMPGQLTKLQQAMGVRGPQDCIGKNVEHHTISSSELKLAFESIVGSVAEEPAVVA